MRALAEVGAVVQKAARGAGVPLGQAEDLARLAVYVAGTGGDLALIADALAAPSGPLDVRWGADQITVAAGPDVLVAPVVRDAFAIGSDRAVLADLAQVPLVVAMLAQAGIAVRIAGAVIERVGPMAPDVPVGPVQVSDDIWSVFEGFAARTYVAASAASRVSGAGAGLTDND